MNLDSNTHDESTLNKFSQRLPSPYRHLSRFLRASGSGLAEDLILQINAVLFASERCDVQAASRPAFEKSN